MQATAFTTKERPKENSSHSIRQMEETKATKERQTEFLTKEKERIQPQCATGVANQAIWQKNAEQRCTTCQKHCRCKIKIEQHNGMTQTMGTTAAGTGTTSQATTAHNHLSNSNSWLCQHHLLTAKHQQSTLWQHWASRQRVTTGMQQQLCKQFSNNEETQRQSNTRLSNMVCTRLTTVSTTAWTRSTTEDSSR